MTGPRVLTEAEWDRGSPDLPYPPDACPWCHRRPGFHAPDCVVITNPPPSPSQRSGRQDALDKDPEGTVARARGLYLRALGRDPEDSTGLVSRLREGALAVAKEAERRRLVRDAKATKEKWDAIRAAQHGRAYQVARNIWYGIPMTGAPELFYPELPDEDALNRGEWLEWAQNHKQAGADAMIDHLASLIPPNEGETYEHWRMRLKARRRMWSVDTDEAVVNRSLSAPPRPAGPRSPGRSRTGGARKARKRRPR